MSEYVLTTDVNGKSVIASKEGYSVEVALAVPGPRGPQGLKGDKGDKGDAGEGVVDPSIVTRLEALEALQAVLTGGLTGQVLVKASDADFDFAWAQVSIDFTITSDWTSTAPQPTDDAGSDAIIAKNVAASVPVSVGEFTQYYITGSGGTWTSEAGTYNPNDELFLRFDLPETYSTSRTYSLTIGGVTRTITITTAAAVSDVIFTKPPAIEGVPTDGLNVRFFLGDVEGEQFSHYEFAVFDQNGGAVIERQAASGDYKLENIVGKTLTLHGYAVDKIGGFAESTSAPFGPVVAGDQLIHAFAFADSESSAIGLSQVPIPWVPIIGNSGSKLFPQVNEEYPDLNWGASAGTISVSFVQNITQRSQFAGRHSANVATDIRVELPEAGEYVIYAALGITNSTGNVNMAIRANDATSTLLYNLAPTVGGANGNIVDVMGNARTEDAYLAESVAGGTPVTITVPPTTDGSKPSIKFARAGGGSTPNIIRVAVFKKAAI